MTPEERAGVILGALTTTWDIPDDGAGDLVEAIADAIRAAVREAAKEARTFWWIGPSPVRPPSQEARDLRDAIAAAIEALAE